MRTSISRTLRTALLFTVVLVLCTAGKRPALTIFMIGDSTMANKSIANGNLERGWGMVLQGFFTDRVVVDNHAVNGRSSKSFIDEGRWDKVLEKMKKGDYVFIQFGHNDEKPQPDRHTDVGSTFDANLERFVTETRERGGIPVLFNCVVRRNFQSEAKLGDDDEKLRNSVYEGETNVGDVLIDTHGEYAKAPRRVAERLHVPFVDANAITHNLEQSLGAEKSKDLHLWLLPGQVPSHPKGRQDNTHYSVYGAHVVAGLLVDEIARQVPALKKYVRHYDYIVSDEGRGNFMTLQEAVDAVPVGQKAVVRVLHGDWQKPVVPEGKRVKLSVSSHATVH